jgi:NADPH-dependent curcumin reductase CurA
MKIEVGYYQIKPEYRTKYFSNKMNVICWRECNKIGDTVIIDKVIDGEGYSRKMKIITKQEDVMFRPITQLEEFEMKQQVKLEGLSIYQETSVGGVLKQIVAAAIKYPGDIIVCGSRHYSSAMKSQINPLKVSGAIKLSEGVEGFIDQFDNFYTRQEAMAIVFCNGQPFDYGRNGDQNRELYSEGVW